jgi:hypothetical protein
MQKVCFLKIYNIVIRPAADTSSIIGFLIFSAHQRTHPVRAGVRKEGNVIYLFDLFRFAKHMT